MKIHELRRIIVIFLITTFVTNFLFSSNGWAQPLSPLPQTPTSLFMPEAGVRVPLSKSFAPPLLKGLKINPDNPFQFDFMVNKGAFASNDKGLLEPEIQRMIKYFFAGLTVSAQDVWVNLSPYERNRIIPDVLSRTEMGRDLLAQDYLLKQVVSSLTYPESVLGESFWEEIYQRLYQSYGHTDIPVDIVNKVWIVPKETLVHQAQNSVFVVKGSLKVMLEEDYLALEEKFKESSYQGSEYTDTAILSSEVLRDIIIPQLEKEVNEGINFARVRQIYHSLILARWYKDTLKESLLGQIYVDKGKVSGIDIHDKEMKERIYQQYLTALKKGAYSYIREDYDYRQGDILPRKYFSGGMQLAPERLTQVPEGTALQAMEEQGDFAMLVTAEIAPGGKKNLWEKIKSYGIGNSSADSSSNFSDDKKSLNPPNPDDFEVVIGDALQKAPEARDKLKSDEPEIQWTPQAPDESKTKTNQELIEPVDQQPLFKRANMYTNIAFVTAGVLTAGVLLGQGNLIEAVMTLKSLPMGQAGLTLAEMGIISYLFKKIFDTLKSLSKKEVIQKKNRSMKSRIKFFLKPIYLTVFYLSLVSSILLLELKTSMGQSILFNSINHSLSWDMQPGEDLHGEYADLSFKNKYGRTGDSQEDLRGYSIIKKHLIGPVQETFGLEVYRQANQGSGIPWALQQGISPSYPHLLRIPLSKNSIVLPTDHAYFNSGLLVTDDAGFPMFHRELIRAPFQNFNDIPDLLREGIALRESGGLFEGGDIKSPVVTKRFVWLAFKEAFKMRQATEGGASTIPTQRRKMESTIDQKTKQMIEKILQVFGGSLDVYQYGNQTDKAVEEIFLEYFNTVYFGPKIEGFSSAFFRYFGRDRDSVISDYNLPETSTENIAKKARVLKEGLMLGVVLDEPSSYIKMINRLKSLRDKGLSLQGNYVEALTKLLEESGAGDAATVLAQKDTELIHAILTHKGLDSEAILAALISEDINYINVDKGSIRTSFKFLGDSFKNKFSDYTPAQFNDIEMVIQQIQVLKLIHKVQRLANVIINKLYLESKMSTELKDAAKAFNLGTSPQVNIVLHFEAKLPSFESYSMHRKYVAPIRAPLNKLIKNIPSGETTLENVLETNTFVQTTYNRQLQEDIHDIIEKEKKNRTNKKLKYMVYLVEVDNSGRGYHRVIGEFDETGSIHRGRGRFGSISKIYPQAAYLLKIKALLEQRGVLPELRKMLKEIYELELKAYRRKGASRRKIENSLLYWVSKHAYRNPERVLDMALQKSYSNAPQTFFTNGTDYRPRNASYHPEYETVEQAFTTSSNIVFVGILRDIRDITMAEILSGYKKAKRLDQNDLPHAMDITEFNALREASDADFFHALERLAFARIEQNWHKFGLKTKLYPSLSVTLGIEQSLAETVDLMTYIHVGENNQTQKPITNVKYLQFAPGTPWQVDFRPKRSESPSAIPASISKRIVRLMEGVVKSGTARRAQSPLFFKNGLTIRGKTGTDVGKLTRDGRKKRTGAFIFSISNPDWNKSRRQIVGIVSISTNNPRIKFSSGKAAKLVGTKLSAPIVNYYKRTENNKNQGKRRITSSASSYSIAQKYKNPTPLMPSLKVIFFGFMAVLGLIALGKNILFLNFTLSESMGVIKGPIKKNPQRLKTIMDKAGRLLQEAIKSVIQLIKEAGLASKNKKFFNEAVEDAQRRGALINMSARKKDAIEFKLELFSTEREVLFRDIDQAKDRIIQRARGGIVEQLKEKSQKTYHLLSSEMEPAGDETVRKILKVLTSLNINSNITPRQIVEIMKKIELVLKEKLFMDSKDKNSILFEIGNLKNASIHELKKIYVRLNTIDESSINEIEQIISSLESKENLLKKILIDVLKKEKSLKGSSISGHHSNDLYAIRELRKIQNKIEILILLSEMDQDLKKEIVPLKQKLEYLENLKNNLPSALKIDRMEKEHNERIETMALKILSVASMRLSALRNTLIQDSGNIFSTTVPYLSELIQIINNMKNDGKLIIDELDQEKRIEEYIDKAILDLVDFYADEESMSIRLDAIDTLGRIMFNLRQGLNQVIREYDLLADTRIQEINKILKQVIQIGEEQKPVLDEIFDQALLTSEGTIAKKIAGPNLTDPLNQKGLTKSSKSSVLRQSSELTQSPGGIAFTEKTLSVETQGDIGPIHFKEAYEEFSTIDRFTPVIVNIRFINNVPAFFGFGFSN